LLPPGLRPLAKKGVVVTISPKGRLRVLYEGRELAYRTIPLEPKAKPEPVIQELPRVGPRYRDPAPPDHPWRQFQFGRGRTMKAKQEPESLKALTLQPKT
jgi:hypothetical protein